MWHLILLAHRGKRFLFHGGEGRGAIEFTWNLCIRKNHIKWNLGPCLVSNTSSLPNRNLSWVSVQLKPCLFSTCSNCCLIQMSNLIFLGCSHTTVMSLTEILQKKFKVCCLFRGEESMFRWGVFLLSSWSSGDFIAEKNRFFQCQHCCFK